MRGMVGIAAACALLSIGWGGCGGSGTAANADATPDAGDLAMPDTPDTPDAPDVSAPDAPDLPADLPPADMIPDVPDVPDVSDIPNPADADAWAPDLTERPRLFFGPADIATMQSRTAATDGPWAALWSRMQGVADQTLPTYPAGPYDQKVGMALGAIAESAAMRGLLAADPAYTAKALAALTIDFPDPSDLAANSNYDLEEAETLVPMCIAFDLAAGTPGVDATTLAAARTNLVKRIDTYRWMGHEGPVAFLLLSSHNNHVMKFFATLGVCAMALNDRPEAAADMSEAMTGLDWMMNSGMSSAEGAWGEGWNYLVYGGRSYIPFFAAYHRWAKGATFPYFGVPNLQPSDTPHTGRVDPIADFVVNARTRAVFERALWSLQPDGRTPNTDDANPEVLPGGILAWLFDDARFLFAWFRPAAGFPDQGSPTAAFALYDGASPPADLGLPLEDSVPDAGFAIFRSSWATDATYLVLQGEHGIPRTADPGHEHPDELSFLLWHGGRPLLIDPGYINYPNHALVNAAEDHNVILVDGQGTPVVLLAGYPTSVGVDALLDPMVTDRFVTSTRVTATYRGATFVRRIARLDGRFFVVEDRIDGGGTSHAYTWLMNGMGGADVPDSSYEALDDGARWTNGTSKVEVRVQSATGTTARESDTQEHCTVWGQWAMHQRLKATATMATIAGFAALVLPTADGEAGPAVAVTSQVAPGVVSMVWQTDGPMYAAYSNQTANTYSSGAGAEIQFDASPGLTLIRVPGAGGASYDRVLLSP